MKTLLFSIDEGLWYDNSSLSHYAASDGHRLHGESTVEVRLVVGDRIATGTEVNMSTVCVKHNAVS